jgi:LacI family transcriptional regulator
VATTSERAAPSRRGRRASISDVARQAGVSLGTVSNVLNRPDRVSEATRDRVQRAIEELSFIPNGSARQLRAGTITTVGAVLLDIGNPFFTEVARGVEDRLGRDDYTLMLASSDGDPARESRYLRLFEEHGVLGVLVTPAGHDLEHLLELRSRGVAVPRAPAHRVHQRAAEHPAVRGPP